MNLVHSNQERATAFKPPFLVALDIGSGVGRCFIFDSQGNAVSSAQKEWTRSWLGTDWNAEIAWQALSSVTQEAIRKAGVRNDEIAGVGSTSIRQQLALLDKNDKPLSFPADLELMLVGGPIAEKYGERMYLSSGHWPMQGFMAPSLLAYAQQFKPEEFRKIHAILSLNDWALFRLSDQKASEPAGACETCLFDISRLAWNTELIDALGFPEHAFPRILKNGEVVGEVTRKAADETGLRAGTPVVVGGPDTQCGLIGTGAINEGDTAAVAGTTTPIQMVLSKPVFDGKWRTWTCCHAAPNLWVLESNAGLTGWILRWFRDEFMEAEATLAKMTGVDIYDIINREVEKTPIGANKLFASMGPQIFNTRNSTVPMGGLFGIAPTSKKTGKGEIARAIIENTCYAVRGNVEQLEEIAKTKVGELHFCGGASKSTVWAQIQSDVLGVPVLVPRVKEASALGSAICAGIGANVYRSIRDAVEKAVRLENRIEPNPKNHEAYNELYDRWLRIHSKFKEMVETEDAIDLTDAFLWR
jgi:autoinducer 2 (AI-2) kinase